MQLHPSRMLPVPSLWRDGELHVEAEREGGRKVTLRLHQRVSRFAGPRTHRPWWLDDDVAPAGFDSTGGLIPLSRSCTPLELSVRRVRVSVYGREIECALPSFCAGVVWEAGLALAARLLCGCTSDRVIVQDKTVVELGSGTGLVRHCITRVPRVPSSRCMLRNGSSRFG